jgi:hypothetical protein
MMRSKVKDARERVAVLRTALLSPSPEELERCVPDLMKAAVGLGLMGMGSMDQELQEHRGEHPEIAGELAALKNDLRLVKKLIEHGAGLHQGWARLLGAAAAGYTPSGEASPLAAASAVSVEG